MEPHLVDIPSRIETQRTVIKRFEEGDGANVLKLINDNQERIFKHLDRNYTKVKDVNSAEAFVQNQLLKWADHSEFIFAIWDKAEKLMIGMVMIKNCDWWVRKSDLAYHLDQNWEGQGIMTEVLKAAIRLSFETLGLEKINARTALDNYGSQQVLLKNGFVFEGKKTNDYRRISGELVDINNYGLTRELYENFI